MLLQLCKHFLELSNLDIKTRLDIGLSMQLRSPIDVNFKLLSYDKFGVIRPPSIDPKQKAHSGVDLRPHQNGGSKNVFACEAGRVINNTPNKGSYIAIEHDNGWVTLYLHLTQRLPKIGSRVSKGQRIGVYGSHLHLTVRVGGIDRNPEDYINFNPSKPQPQMTNQKLIDAINSGTNFDPETKKMLIGAVNNDDGNYLVVFAGDAVRGELIQVRNQVDTLTTENLELQKQLEEAKKVQDVRIVENPVVNQTQTVKSFVPRTESLKAGLGMLKNTILPSLGTILVGFGVSTDQIAGIVGGLITLTGAILLELDKTNYNKQEKENVQPK